MKKNWLSRLLDQSDDFWKGAYFGFVSAVIMCFGITAYVFS